MVKIALKEQLGAASTGHSLLKKKSDSIKMTLNTILKQILQVKRRVGKGTADSFFALSEAHWSAGNINDRVIEHAQEATYKVNGKIRNVAGVKIPVFTRFNMAGSRAQDIVGLARGGEQVSTARESFTSLLTDLVALASLQTSLKTLDEALKVTNRRVNALEFVVMPRLSKTIKYVDGELDEMEREDTYRIKKVKDIRAKIQEAADAEREAAEEEQEEDVVNMLEGYGTDEDDITGDILGD